MFLLLSLQYKHYLFTIVIIVFNNVISSGIHTAVCSTQPNVMQNLVQITD